MDFSTLKKHLLSGKYKTYQEFLANLQLIWDNCKLYNSLGSDLYKLALKMEKLSRRELEKFKQENGLPALSLRAQDPPAPATKTLSRR